MVFGDQLDVLPVVAQPLLFYPDWFFLDWPYQLIQAYSNSAHPYYIGMGPMAFGFGAFWFIIGSIISSNADDGMVKEAMTIRHFPISPTFIGQCQSKGALGQLSVLPLVIVNLIYALIVKIVAIALFWHIAIASVLGELLSLRGLIGNDLTAGLKKIILVLMIAPPLLNIIVRTIELI
jgi:hypothetical protein